MPTQIETWHGYVLQQMASEAYLEGVALTDRQTVLDALAQGNNRPAFNVRGLTRFSERQAIELVDNYEIKHQWSDNPTPVGARPIDADDPGYISLAGQQVLANSGLSATLFRSASNPNEYTLAIRSTEFQNWKVGGDYERDGNGADVEVFFKGFPLAQVDALERYYEWLKNSTGGNLLLREGARDARISELARMA